MAWLPFQKKFGNTAFLASLYQQKEPNSSSDTKTIYNKEFGFKISIWNKN